MTELILAIRLQVLFQQDGFHDRQQWLRDRIALTPAQAIYVMANQRRKAEG